jgi:hypothetical protein
MPKVNARTRRSTARFAALGLAGALMLGGLAAAAVHFGESLWVLTAPPDRLAALLSSVESAPVIDRAPDRVGDRVANRAAAASRAPKRGDSSVPTRATTANAAAGAGAADDESTTPAARVGARIAVSEPATTEIADEVAAGGEARAPTFTTEVQNGRTIYRVNGELLLDPGHMRGEPVEVGFEWHFGQRGLEKVKLWEMRR